MSFWRGLRRAGRKALRGVTGGARKVINTAKRVRDVYNKVRDAPIIGNVVRAGENLVPPHIRKKVEMASRGLDVADNLVGAGERLARGDVRGAFNQGRQGISQGLALRR